MPEAEVSFRIHDTADPHRPYFAGNYRERCQCSAAPIVLHKALTPANAPGDDATSACNQTSSGGMRRPVQVGVSSFQASLGRRMLHRIFGRASTCVRFSAVTKVAGIAARFVLAASLLAPALPTTAVAGPSLPSTNDNVPVVPSGISNPKPDTYAGYGSGDHTESVSIAVPPFRGFEPSISLNYSSGRQLTYDPDGNGWLGRGWSLGGIPAIERISRGGGAPRFDSSDVYTFGGDQMIACGSITSPSCATGGTHATRIESYRRIKFESGTNTWKVWDRDGTRYEFYPVAETASPPSDPIIQQLANNYRWLLRRAFDTHGNVVTYTYSCDQYISCRINKIGYSAAEVFFRWETRPDPVTYATGLNRLTITQRLKTVEVRFNTALVRAYAISYDTSAVTGSSRLTSVQQFGSDATVASNGTVTAGATPPLPARTFTYQSTLTVGTTVKLCESSLSSPGTGPLWIVGQSNLRDGILYPTGCTPTGAAPASSAVSFPANTSSTPAGPNSSASYPGSPVVTTEYRLRGYADFNGDNTSDQFGDVVKVETFPGDEVVETVTDGYIVVPPSTIRQTGAMAQFIGDVNGDGRDDVVYQTGVRLGTSSGLAATANWGAQLTQAGCDTQPCPFVSKGIFDVNGDGKGDLVGFFNRGPNADPRYVMAWRLSNGSSWGPQTDLPYYFGGRAGDYDGDGKADFTVTMTTPGNVAMLFSNGNGYEPALLPSGGGGHDQDLNGDGRTDSVSGTTNTSRIYYSTGNGFLPGPVLSTMPAQQRFVGFADLYGDGLPDIITKTEYSPVAIYATPISGTIPDLMVSTKNEYGGVTDLTYRPSADFVNTMSFIKPVVSTITVKDGINPPATTTLTYAGGKYDATERMFLGFATVTIDKPCNTGETACPRTFVSYRQDFAAVGVPYYIDDRSPGGYTLHSIYNAFSINNTTAPFTALKTIAMEGYGNGSTQRLRETDYAYDSYGQVNKTFDLGANDWTGDERTTVLTRYPNTSAYIVDRVAVEAIKAGNETAPNIRYTETRYDGATTTSTPPTKGDPTAVTGYTDLITSVTKYGYDSVGNRTSVTDPTNNVTTTTYDATYALFPVKTTNALSQETTYTWSLICSSPSGKTDANNLTTTYGYDAHCRFNSQIDPDFNWVSIAYRNMGTPSMQSVWLERPSTNGNIWEERFVDGLGRAYWRNTRAPSNNTYISSVKYSQRGAVAEYNKPFLYSGAAGGTPYPTKYVQDVLDRTVKITLPDSRVRTITYGIIVGAGRPFDLYDVYDELGRTTETQRDAFGRTAKTIETVGATSFTTLLNYDVLGNITKVFDPADNVWVFEYDQLGRRISEDDPDRGTWTFDYDAAGRLTTKTDALGQKTRLSYDALGRVLTRTSRFGLANAETTTNTYDQMRSGFYNIGSLTTASNAVASITYDQDKGGRQVKRSWTVVGLTGAKTETASFGASDQLLWRGWPDGTATGSATSPWTYDEAGRLYSIPGLITWTSYTASDQVRQIQYANGIRTDNYYDESRDWLTDIYSMVGNTQTAVMTNNYNRDAAGRITRWVVGASSQSDTSYTYDALDRLKKADNATSGIVRTYSYNLAGSMTANSGLGTYVYPTQGAGAVRPHAPLSVAGTAYSYDANGSLLSDGVWTFAYDGENRLVSATSSTRSLVYSYGPDGDRIKTVSTPTGGTPYVGYQLGDTRIASNGLNSKVPHPDIRMVGSDDCVVNRDHLGSIRTETDATKTVQLRLRYASFGLRTQDYQGTGCTIEDRAFIGERYEANSDLIDLNARWYDPITGLFLTPDWLDPVDGDTARAGKPVGWRDDPVGTNRYAYAGQDPINRSDPSGHAIDRNADTARALALLGAAPAQTTKQRETVGTGTTSAGLGGGQIRVAGGVNLGNDVDGDGQVTELEEEMQGVTRPRYITPPLPDVGVIEPLPFPGWMFGAFPKSPSSAVRSGETAATKAGRDAHKAWDPGANFVKEFRLPSGKRADAVDTEQLRVKELKPNNPRAVTRGTLQVERYRQELEHEFGGNWIGTVETYEKE